MKIQFPFQDHPVFSNSMPVPLALAMGDVVAFLLFVVIGRLSHGFVGDWLVSMARIATPFLLGWFVAAVPAGAYRAALLRTPGRFLLGSAAAWLLGDGISFVLRALLFRDNVTVPFALVSVAFTGLFVLGWRIAYVWWYNHRGIPKR